MNIFSFLRLEERSDFRQIIAKLINVSEVAALLQPTRQVNCGSGFWKSNRNINRAASFATVFACPGIH